MLAGARHFNPLYCGAISSCAPYNGLVEEMPDPPCGLNLVTVLHNVIYAQANVLNPKTTAPWHRAKALQE